MEKTQEGTRTGLRLALRISPLILLVTMLALPCLLYVAALWGQKGEMIALVALIAGVMAVAAASR